jgi:hypothetical protein
MLPSSDYIIADRGYDSEALREQIRNKNAIPVRFSQSESFKA